MRDRRRKETTSQMKRGKNRLLSLFYGVATLSLLDPLYMEGPE